MMVLLGSGTAEERVISFLLNLSTRLLARGYSSSDFNLRMGREAIGNYLGSKLETDSRVLSRLHEQSVLDVDGDTCASWTFPPSSAFWEKRSQQPRHRDSLL